MIHLRNYRTLPPEARRSALVVVIAPHEDPPGETLRLPASVGLGEELDVSPEGGDALET
jgi:hypothetical protein